MLSLILGLRKKKDSLNDTISTIQSGDSVLLNEFIDSYKPFVAKVVSSVCKRYIDESDDEFSIGLIAFNDAIQNYNEEKGTSLFNFAEVIIKNRVIDYIRKQSKYQQSTLLYNTNETVEEDTATNYIENTLSIDNYQIKTEQEIRREEILLYSETLKKFGLTFHDLVRHTPKHLDARKNAIEIANLIAMNEELKLFLLEKKKLPIKKLEKMVQVSRKTIERNRKYIISMALILIGDYLYLKEYVKGVLET